MEEKTYSISQVAKMLDIPVSTLRYYDSRGLLPGIQRKPSGYRSFTEKDLENLHLIRCFKLAGMPIKDIHQYFLWSQEGDGTLSARYHLILERKNAIERQIALLNEQMRIVEKKAAWYENRMMQKSEETT